MKKYAQISHKFGSRANACAFNCLVSTEDMPSVHSKLGFKVKELRPKLDVKPVKGSSIPLILPNDLKYNATTGVVEKAQGVRRKSLQVVPEALALLEGIQEPVSVLAICGPCRSGKSYILSRLLDTSDAFELGHLMDPQTFGIWMGTKVLRGKDFTIVLLDTEGIDAVGASAGQDASILVMTILLSSLLIYNSLNVPYKGDLEKMQCFIKLAKGITVKQGERTSQSELPDFFPDFLWLLRDVSLKMQSKDGKDMDPTEYLKAKVLVRHGENGSTSHQVGKAILTSFSSVECATLESPSQDSEIMTDIAQHTDNLNPRFNQGVHALIERLLLKSRAKRGYDKGSTVNGEALSIMITQYVEAINDPSSIPSLDNTWKTTVEVMRSRAIEQAVLEYKKQMQAQLVKSTRNGHVPLEEGTTYTIIGSRPTIMDLHNRQFKIAKGILLEKVGHLGASAGDLGKENQNVVDQLEKRLVRRGVGYVAEGSKTYLQMGFEVTGGELFHYIQRNREISKSVCQQLSERLLDPIRKRMESPPPDYDFQTFIRELGHARQQYNEQAGGPMKWTVLQEITRTSEQLKTDFFITAKYQRELQREQRRVQTAERQFKESERELRELRRQILDMMIAWPEIIHKKQLQHMEMIETVEQEAEKQRGLEKNRYQELANTLKEVIDGMEKARNGSNVMEKLDTLYLDLLKQRVQQVELHINMLDAESRYCKAVNRLLTFSYGMMYM